MTNFLLHKHRRDDVQFKRPDGLTELLSDISREVLREQPECVCTFVADYLEAMLVTREQTLIASRTRNTVFDIAMTISDMMRNVGLDLAKATKSAYIIEQSLQRAIVNDQQDDVLIDRSALVIEADILGQLVSQCGFNREELHKAQHIIQVCFKDYYFREKEFTLKLNRLPYDNWANKVERTLDIYRKSGPQRWELERAAVAIQAAYRGYYSRKAQRDLVRMNEMATTIQATYRGYSTRKHLEALKMENENYPSQISKLSPQSDVLIVNKTDNLDFNEVYQGSSATVACPLPTKMEPDANEAATKIQALYRGHKVRQGIKLEAKAEETSTGSSTVDEGE